MNNTKIGKMLYILILFAVIIQIFGGIDRVDARSIIDKSRAIKVTNGDAQVVRSNSRIPAKYAITPKFTNRTKLTVSGARAKNGITSASDPILYVDNLREDTPLNIKARYSNIGKYMGQDVDLVIEVQRVVRSGYMKNSPGWIGFAKDSIAFGHRAYSSVSLKFNYVYGGTDRGLDVEGSYLNIADLDGRQAVRFSNAKQRRIDGIYATSNTKVKQWTSRTGGSVYYGDTDNINLGRSDEEGQLLMLFKGNHFSFDWYVDYTDTWDPPEIKFFMETFFYTGKKLVESEPNTPIKRVINEKGVETTSNKISSKENSMDYVVYHNVLDSHKKHYFTSYVFEDEINSALKVNKVTIYNSNGTNVTNRFKNETKGNKVRYVAPRDELNNSRFYGQEYKFVIDVSLNRVGGLETNNDGEFEIPNTAKVRIGGKDYKTNTVKTKGKIPKVQAPVKTVSDSNVTDVKSNTLSPLGDTVTYKVTHNVASDFKNLKFSEYKFEDKIDEAWDIISAKVINGNNNRETKKFDIDITNNKVTATAKKNELNDNGFYGKDYILVIKVKAKDPEDLIWITKGEPTYQLTNKASVTINDETKDSNVVTTTIKYNPKDLYITRCHHNKNNKEHKDEVVGVTSNDVVVTKGYFPSGSSAIYNFEFRSEVLNESHNMLLNKKPKVGWSESEWNQWKKDFQNGSLNTKSIDFKKFVEETGLEEVNVKRILQENGGILNVERLHHKSKMSVELCQEQVRTPNFETQEWEWHDKGGKEVHKIKDPEYNISVERDSYQILGVNCNVDGANRVIKDFEANYEIEDHSYDTGSGASRLLVVRPKKPGTPFPLGKVNHYTGKDNFYKPDGIVWKNSCQADLSKACKSTPLSGSEVKNDSNKNNNNKTFSMVENPGNSEEYHFPGDKNQIMFFRDNEDRQVRADVWYLDKNDKTYSSNKNAAAKQTDLRVLSGTPEIDITTVSPWDTADSINEFGKDSTYKKHINRINVKSRWASKANEPYKVGMAWTYEATAKNSSVVEIDGYKINKLETNEHEFDAICSFQKKPGSYQAVIPRNLFVNGKIDSNDKWKFSDTMEIVFTRSISDRVTGE